MDSLDEAIVIAVTAHRGQLDKVDQPYILHPLRVMLKMRTMDEKIVGVLHDVIEDTKVTAEMLSADFSPHIIEALKCITHIENEPIKNYIKRLNTNRIAIAVKIEDIRDNLLPERFNLLNTVTKERLEKKYEKILAELNYEEAEWRG